MTAYLALIASWLIVAAVLSGSAYISRALDAIERRLDRQAGREISERCDRARGVR